VKLYGSKVAGKSLTLNAKQGENPETQSSTLLVYSLQSKRFLFMTNRQPNFKSSLKLGNAPKADEAEQKVSSLEEFQMAGEKCLSQKRSFKLSLLHAARNLEASATQQTGAVKP
jgi:hypothetical protein